MTGERETTMARAVRLRTTVLAGGRIDIRCEELAPGSQVEVIVLAPEERSGPTALGFLASLPARAHSAEEWAEIERELTAERDAWPF